MTPENPDNDKPFIYRIADALGVNHQVVPVNHSHRDLVGESISLVINGNEIELTTEDLPNILRALSDPNTVPTANSDKLITSGGVYSALAGKMDNRQFDSEPTANSDKLITSGGVYSALSGKMDSRQFDSEPTANSDKLITSGGVYSALAGKMDNRQFDSEPTLNSTNLVTSGVVKAALDRKANNVHTHVASQVEGVMPYYVTYDGNSINLDDILTEPHTMQRLIIENAESSSFDIVTGLFTSQTENLVIHINNTPEQFVVGPGDYALVTIFKVDRGDTAHGHDVCYFAYVEGIFNYES